jgi:protein-serine/threonine kinase
MRKSEDRPPTPPASSTGADSGDDSTPVHASQTGAQEKPSYQYFDARTTRDEKLRRWRCLRLLGEGTFSKVMLATSQLSIPDLPETGSVSNETMEGIEEWKPEAKVDPKTLVAVKICQQGAKGGADEDRINISLKRELEIMKSVHHPSIVHLKAWNVEDTRAILVLNYCPGGDLFDVASQYRDLLVPSLLRRMFSELVGAVRYLHSAHIVHRDIKLESEFPCLMRHVRCC